MVAAALGVSVDGADEFAALRSLSDETVAARLTEAGLPGLVPVITRGVGKLREQGSNDIEHQVTHTYCLNPKSISMGELYGNYNLMTNEWTDGLGSTIIRNANSDTTDDKKFVVFDGPIDAIWIENMAFFK